MISQTKRIIVLLDMPLRLLAGMTTTYLAWIIAA
jgi:hypothetical protein